MSKTGVELLCSQCGKTYSNVTNLNKHMRMIHSGRKKKEKPGKFYCEFCCKCYLRLFNLKRHIQSYHSATSKERNFKFFCALCPCRFRYKTNYNQHLKQRHKIFNKSARKSQRNLSEHKCAICGFKSTKKTLLVHFVENHNIILQETKYFFDSLQEFISWKSSYEYDTNSKFIMDYSNLREGFLYRSYKCYHHEIRAHDPYSHKNQNEELYCPANIKLKKPNNKACTVVVLDTHVGHKLRKKDLKVDKLNEESLLTKIPFNDLFDEVRSSISESNVPILTEPVLYKIETSFNLFTSLKDSNDALELDLWIKDLQDLNVVLFYKAEGCIFKDYPELKTEEFVLVLMTDAQAQMLLKYGSDGVCIDRYPGVIKRKRIHLVTILVEDEIGEVLPCGFLISNKLNIDILKIFFAHVKHRVGAPIEPNVFMADTEPCFAKAWVSAMLPASMFLFNPWSVDFAWRRNLKLKVKRIEKQLEVYQLLWTLWEQTDHNIFETQLQNVCESLSQDPETANFALYFKTHFISHGDSWAYCHKGLNNNLCFEKTHRALKCMHLMGQKVERFDKSIGAIMRFIRNKYVDRFVLSDAVNLIQKMQNICLNHKSSLEIDLEFVNNNPGGGWSVLSSDQTKLYSVQKVKDDCDCQLKCFECNSCLHQYICSCIDCTISYNMCKHIHLVCRLPESATVSIPMPINYSVEVTFADDSDDDTSEYCNTEFIEEVDSAEKTCKEMRSNCNAESSEVLVMEKHVEPLLETAKKSKNLTETVK
ncbi:uncharacterized protein LOC126750560 [Anthonomus grandis grandis]|uniref:uncharacterized protein LOC126750560 n=1 Tax=Anthonomus grandis grandis TaxID=2921223 RepID=UPI0021658864|nr:uncharacterized protein LOC126750560 [Anthonomus grandis grandis]XP_050316162.1 uncharacterized protein LOC126750560 [Anthonomus grandis grandis]